MWKMLLVACQCEKRKLAKYTSCPGACLSQEPWGHSCLMNIFVGEMIAGFPNYVWVPCARVACDLELKVWVTLCALDLKIFAACWSAAWESYERNECFPQKKRADKYKCMPSNHGLPGQEPPLWWFIPLPQLGWIFRTWRNDFLWTH